MEPDRMNGPRPGVPREIIEKAIPNDHGGAFAWKPADFPAAVEAATRRGYCCVGGVFQFRFPGATYEPYWLSTDFLSRDTDESWSAYVARCHEYTLSTFDKLLRETDWDAEVSRFSEASRDRGAASANPLQYLVFEAIFENEAGHSF